MADRLTSIPEQLRDVASIHTDARRKLLNEAADEIERLRAALAECATGILMPLKPDRSGFDYKVVMREVNRRQNIAANAIGMTTATSPTSTYKAET